MRLSASGVHQQWGVPLLPLALVGEVSLYGTASHVVMACVDTIPLETQLSRIQNIQPHIVVGTPTRLARIADHSPHILGEKMRRMVDTIIVDEADLVFREPGGIKLVERLFRRRREEVPAQLVVTSASVDAVSVKRFNQWTDNDNSVLRLTTSHMQHALPDTLAFYLFCAATQPPLHALARLVMHGRATKGDAFRALVFGPDARPLLDGLRQLGIAEASHQLVTTASKTPAPMSVGVCDFTSARGLHVPEISDVFVVGAVPTPAEFLHVAGRTGRMGASGDVSVVFTPYEARQVHHLCDVYAIPFRLSKC